MTLRVLPLLFVLSVSIPAPAQEIVSFTPKRPPAPPVLKDGTPDYPAWKKQVGRSALKVPVKPQAKPDGTLETIVSQPRLTFFETIPSERFRPLREVEIVEIQKDEQRAVVKWTRPKKDDYTRVESDALGLRGHDARAIGGTSGQTPYEDGRLYLVMTGIRLDSRKPGDRIDLKGWIHRKPETVNVTISHKDGTTMYAAPLVHFVR